MIIKNCPLILCYKDESRCLYHGILNSSGCSSLKTCPFKDVLKICQIVKNDELSGTRAQENAKKWAEMFEVEI